MLERLDSLLDHHLAALTSRMNELKGLENELASYRDRIQRRIETDSSR